MDKQLNISINMEEYHRLHVHRKKKSKEYLFGFFMLFLAVTRNFKNLSEKELP